MLDIYTLDDEVLREDTESVKSFDISLRMLVDAMFETLTEADGVGLAAPQVGVSRKFFIVDLHEGEKGRYVFVNPEIIERVKVQAQDVNGKHFTIDASGLLARVIQHENDHLNKTLFIDHLSEEERERVVKAFRKKNKKKRKKD